MSKRSFSLIILQLCLIAVVPVFARMLNKNIGENCNINATIKGICKPLYDCQRAIRALKHGHYPTTCSFQFNTPIVCCEINVYGTSFNHYDHGFFGEPKLKSKSQEMCRKYGKLIKGSVETNDPCGFSEHTAVLGGHAALEKEFPHMVILGYSDNNEETLWLCGGSLISENFVLTAAHCLTYSNRIPPSVVQMGFLNLKTRNASGSLQEIPIEKIIPHPKYNKRLKQVDIALLQLLRPAILTPYVRPICLYEEFRIAEESAVATGWGKTEYDADSGSDELMEVRLTLYNAETCRRAFNGTRGQKFNINESIQLCAGEFNKNKDTCQGDSGGPLFIKDTRVRCMNTIIGITSFGVQCGVLPGIYTRISYFVPWIESIIWP